MTNTTWEKASVAIPKKSETNLRTLVSGVGFAAILAVVTLILVGTLLGGRFFITVNEVVGNNELVGKTVKITGAVLGDTIHFDADTQTITFTVAHITDNAQELEKLGGLAQALTVAVNDRSATRLQVVVRNQPVPDLLQHEAQAIMTGKMGTDGLFYVDELQLKCPSKYQSDVPKQAEKRIG